MHVGEGEKLSKTEMMYIPDPDFWKKGAIQTLPAPTSPADDTLDDNGEPMLNLARGGQEDETNLLNHEPEAERTTILRQSSHRQNPSARWKPHRQQSALQIPGVVRILRPDRRLRHQQENNNSKQRNVSIKALLEQSVRGPEGKALDFSSNSIKLTILGLRIMSPPKIPHQKTRCVHP